MICKFILFVFKEIRHPKARLDRLSEAHGIKIDDNIRFMKFCSAGRKLGTRSLLVSNRDAGGPFADKEHSRNSLNIRTMQKRHA